MSSPFRKRASYGGSTTALSLPEDQTATDSVVSSAMDVSDSSSILGLALRLFFYLLIMP